MKAKVFVGISCAGKSTKAIEYVRKGYVEINRDNIRFDVLLNGVRDWRKYKFTKKNEERVTEYANAQIRLAATSRWDIVISDTNLNAKYRNQLIERLEKLGYEVEIEEFDISLEEAFKRDQLRANGVGREVIYRQYLQWLEYKGFKKYTPDPFLPPCVIADIDGTIAEKGDRSPFDWDRVDEDKPVSTIMDVVDGLYSQGYSVVFLSGRDSVCRDKTENWLKRYFQFPIELYMREANDSRRDSVVKLELFWKHVADEYNCKMVIDDRKQVLEEVWRPLGIKTIDVGNVMERF